MAATNGRLTWPTTVAVGTVNTAINDVARRQLSTNLPDIQLGIG